jgi:hypothetical protein
MRLLTFNILILLSTQVWSQTDLGIGLVSINFDDKTVLEFYSDTSANESEKVIEFYDDWNTGSWNIKDLEKQKEWLQPEILWLDYFDFTFRCLSQTDKWYELIVNNESQKVFWLKKTNSTQFNNWEEYLIDMFGVERNADFPQQIRTKPTDNSLEVQYQGTDCFEVKSMKGDWIEISTPDYCDEDYTDSKTPIKSGWIKWRTGNKLLINYFPTS